MTTPPVPAKVKLPDVALENYRTRAIANRPCVVLGDHMLILLGQEAKLAVTELKVSSLEV